VTSADIATIEREKAAGAAIFPAWLWLAIGVYVFFLSCGSALLGDSDTYWHIAVGRWILDQGALPHTDIYSFTRNGEPWISSSWLAQVLYALAFEGAGWAGPVMLASASIASAFALFAFVLGSRVPARYAIAVALWVLLLSVSHMFARPHVLVLPLMIAWVHGLLRASEQREPPSFWLLPLLALWANLHGGFVFGLTLVAPIALDALWNAEKAQRVRVAMRWALFAVAALAACCVTPYGWNSILASRKILDLGELLHLIYEWMPVDFGHFGAFEGCILASIGAALYFGVRLTPPRILLLLGLLHMALSHVRNVEIFALLAPLVVLTPLSSQFSLQPAGFSRTGFPAISAVMLAAILAAPSWALATARPPVPPANQAPAAAVEVLKQHGARRILNDLPFAGYFISRGIPVFVDGRAELYGEAFVMDYYRAMQLKDVNVLLELLGRYDIDAVALTPATPAARFMDHAAGWKRLHADDRAVIHMRTAN
jgi:hypothetical protein